MRYIAPEGHLRFLSEFNLGTTSRAALHTIRLTIRPSDFGKPAPTSQYPSAAGCCILFSTQRRAGAIWRPHATREEFWEKPVELAHGS